MESSSSGSDSACKEHAEQVPKYCNVAVMADIDWSLVGAIKKKVEMENLQQTPDWVLGKRQQLLYSYVVHTVSYQSIPIVL